MNSEDNFGSLAERNVIWYSWGLGYAGLIVGFYISENGASGEGPLIIEIDITNDSPALPFSTDSVTLGDVQITLIAGLKQDPYVIDVNGFSIVVINDGTRTLLKCTSINEDISLTCESYYDIEVVFETSAPEVSVITRLYDEDSISEIPE